MIRSRLLAAILVLLVCPLLLFGDTAEPTGAIESPDATVVSIAPFEDNTGSSKWEGLADGLSDLLAVSLARHKAVKVVERRRLAAVLKEQELAYRALSETAVAARVGRLLGADLIVVGGILVVDDKPVITAHMVDIGTTQVVASRKVTGEAADVLALSFKLASELARSLDVTLDPVLPDDYDKDPTASLHFMRGLGFHHAGNSERAAMEFMVCGDLDPDHPTTHYWLGRCFHRMREYDHARIEFRRFLKDFAESPQAADAARLLKECDAKAAPSPLKLSEGETDTPTEQETGGESPGSE